MSSGSFSLRELNAFFVRREERIETFSRVRPEVWAVKQQGPWVDGDFHDVTGPRVYHVHVDTLAEADGVWFDCPKCHAAGSTHGVLCWFVGKVPDEEHPRPGRWIPSGTSLDDLTFVGPGAASVFLTGPAGCLWHGLVQGGRATLD